MRFLKPRVWFCLMVTVSAVSSSSLQATRDQPNILVMLADDQGWGDVGFNGHPSIRTPHLDSLAHQGAHFERFYVQPVCSPTRAEFLTGRHHLRGGVTGVSRGNERLALREQTIADVFRAAGYATGAFGKWHNGSQYPFHPNGRGFDEFYGFTSGHWGNYFDAMMDHNGQVVTGDGYMTDDITSHTIDFIREHSAAAKPFFAYLAFNVPHSPMQVPDSYWDEWNDREIPRDHRYAEDEDVGHTRAALAMVENIDYNLGRVLESLAALGIEENTIVLYFTDNGPNGARWNGDLKGRKGSTDQGGVLSPLFLRWPAHIAPGSSVSTPTAAIDLLPTLTEMSGIAYDPAHPLDGRSFAARALHNQPSPVDSREWIYSHWSGRFSMRNDRWMLDHEGELFDLESDPQQRHAVTSDHPATAAQLRDLLSTWWEEVTATAATSKPAITLGHPDAVYTPLPARDATLVGGLERSNRFPNDSYVRQWTSTEDRLTWEVDVPVDGRFAVTLYYTCPPTDIGATVQLDCGEAVLRAKIDRPWDPPELGAEHDRIPRQESYVKNFAPMALGEIELKPGQTTLALHCPDIPGQTAMEFRLLQFERLP